MKQHMIIGGPQHGQWVGLNGDAHTLVMYEPVERTLTFELMEQWEPPPIVHLPLVALHCPGWKIALRFWAHPSLQLYSGGQLPHGTVMPGWIEGMERDCWPLEARRHFR